MEGDPERRRITRSCRGPEPARSFHFTARRSLFSPPVPDISIPGGPGLVALLWAGEVGEMEDMAVLLGWQDAAGRKGRERS